MTVDGYTPVDHEEAAPAPGDISVCLYCAAVVIFEDAPARWRLPDLLERAEVAANPEVVKARQTILSAQRNGILPRQRNLQ